MTRNRWGQTRGTQSCDEERDVGTEIDTGPRFREVSWTETVREGRWYRMGDESGKTQPLRSFVGRLKRMGESITFVENRRREETPGPEAVRERHLMGLEEGNK